MSMDRPNEYEEAIEAYAAAVRRENEAVKASLAAGQAESDARLARQEAWRKVSAYVAEGKIQPGIYRLHRGHEPYADGLLIQKHQDYPELFPMFR